MTTQNFNWTSPLPKDRTLTENILNAPKKSKSQIGDRFIPNRASRNLDLSHFKLMNNDHTSQGKDTCSNLEEYKNVLAQSLFERSLDPNILCYQHKKEERKGVLNLVHSRKNASTSKQRDIPKTPFKVLDAPGLSDDYYLNLLDWNSNNLLAVGLGDSVYLWNGDNGNVSMLSQFDTDVTSISWSTENANIVAIGTNTSEIHLYDVNYQRRIRTLSGHTDRVSSLAWNKNILTSGSKDSNIINRDIRDNNRILSVYEQHTQEVVGLKWSLDGSQLASGGNDNMLNIWNIQTNSLQHYLNHHTAAVKALAWCPFKSNLLASGGGSADRMIRFWNSQTGTCVNAVDTKSQVSSIIWSKNYKELITSHGYTQNQLCVWKYPTMEKVTELTGHEQRVLYMAMSPDGKVIASAAGDGDETIRFWKVFDKSDKNGGLSPSNRNNSYFKGVTSLR